jgi:Asp/Glu/hydantoin racemase
MKAGDQFDACLIACFGEPGIAAAREVLPFPVVGIAEAPFCARFKSAAATPLSPWVSTGRP